MNLRLQRLRLILVSLLSMLLFTVAGCIQDRPITVDPCVPGTERLSTDDCTVCTCQFDGNWSCTDEFCTEDAPICAEGRACEAVLGACGCDWTCVPEGTVIERVPCAIDCIGPSEVPPQCECQGDQCRIKPVQPTCAAGQTKLAQDGCNVCACTPKGEWVCSETDCSPEQCLGPASCRPVIPPCSCSPICAPVGAEFPPGDCEIACPQVELPPLTCTCADGACVGRVGECRAGEVRFQEPCTECECSANGFWLCSGSSTCEELPPPRVCRPGSAFAETNGQLCRCNNRGAWECECPREGGLPGCICHLGEWACDGDSEPTELPN